MATKRPSNKSAVAGKNSNRSVKKEKRLEAKLKAEGLQVKALKAKVKTLSVNSQQISQTGRQKAVANVSNRLNSEIKIRLTKKEAHAVGIVCLPGEVSPMRINNGHAAYPTSAVKLFVREAVEYNNPTTSPVSVGDPETFAALFRSALCSRIQQYELSNVRVSSLYSGFVFMTIPQGEYAVVNPRALQFGLNSNSSQYMQVVAPTADEIDDDYHGPWLYPCRLGRSDPNRGFWCNTGDIINVSIGITYLNAEKVRIEFLELIGENWVSQGVFDTSGAAQQFSRIHAPSSASAPGSYICVRLTNTNTLAATPSISGVYYPVSLMIFSGIGSVTTKNFIVSANNTTVVAASTTVYAHRALPEIESNFASISDTKINGCSMMFTNTSQMLTRQGDLAGLQVPNNKLWQDHCTFGKIEAKLGVQFTKADEGMYGFLKPTSGAEMADFLGEFETFAVSSNDGASTRSSGPPGFLDGAFIMPPPRPYLVLCGLQDASVSRTAVYTFAWQLEYQTESQWRELAIPSTSLPEIEIGVQALARMPQWHQNDFHIADVFNWLKDAAGTVVNGIIEWGPTILKGAAMAAPFLI